MNNKELLSNFSLLYVEDEEQAKIGMQLILKNKFKHFIVASNGEEGLEKYSKYNTDIVITDIKMPFMDGITMVKEIKKINPKVKVIYTSAHSDSSILIKAIEAGADEYILKPINKTTLIFSITKVANDLLRDKLLEKNNQFLRLILDSQDNLVVVTNGKNILDCNSATLDFMGFDNFEELQSSEKCISDFFIDTNNYIKKDNWLNYSLENSNIEAKMKNARTNEEKIFVIKVTPFVMKDELPEYVVTFTDITDIENHKLKLEYMANTDQLTQIANRSKFKIILEKEIESYKRDKRPFSIIFFDIDHFKHINDTFGHKEGDNVLKQLSKLVSTNIRSSDMVARWGGEEFIVLCTNSDLLSTKLVAEKLRKLIEFTDFGITQKVTCSFGVSEFNKDLNEDLVIKLADDNLYKAKESGRNKVVC